MRLARVALGSRALYELAGRLARFFLRRGPRWLLYGPWNAWGRQRELPPAPARTFRDAWRGRGDGHG